jgi:MFS family permease
MAGHSQRIDSGQTYATRWTHDAMTAPLPLTLLLCAVQMLAMTGSLTFQALIPVFIREWTLTNTEAAWIGGASYVGYAIAAPILVAATDRIDARSIVLSACLVGGIGGIGFALFAEGFWSAAGWRVLTGVAIAGSYMPGLKALTDRLPEGRPGGRFPALYAATFSLASATSLFLAGLLTSTFDWHAAFALTGLTAFTGAALVSLLPKRSPRPASTGGHALTRVGAVLRDRQTMRFILAYAGHSWEMFAFRTWIVAFLTFVAARSGDGNLVLVGLAATALVVAGLPAGLLGNELAERAGRRRAVATLMLAAAAMAALMAFATDQGFVLVACLALVYGALVMADNSAILVGTIQSTPPERRGAAIAVQTFLAATMALLSPLAIGGVLDAFGADATAWGLAFGVMGLGAATGALAMLWPGERGTA